MSDYYDAEIERITKAGESIIPAEWGGGKGLFAFATKDGQPGPHPNKLGCLTMIRGRSEYYEAETPELTAAIRADDRLPRSEEDIRLKHLPVFAEWQRRLNVELERMVPVV